MKDRALVIGLDAYEHQPGWELRAAVRDAVAFADWVTAPGAGRATADTLTLMLSPHPDRPVHGRNFQPATEAAIRNALYEHTTNGADAGRLWFFYAGHGLAPAGGGPDEAPVIVPADVKNLDFYRWNPIELSSWIRSMQVSKPEYQVYFVDACRGIVVSEDVVTATKTLFFDLSKTTVGNQARQAVLFATTAGQLANEQGLHGLFGGALLDGLRGTGPTLEADAGTEEFVLTFGALSAYTKRLIQQKADDARVANRTLPTQEPAESLFRVQSSLELARFKTKPAARVQVFIEPEEAAAVGTAGIRGYNEWRQVWERQAEKPSPLGVPVEWNLPLAFHKIEIEARGYQNWTEKVEVIGPTVLPAVLVPLPSDPAHRGYEPDLVGLERLGVDPSTDEGPRSPDGAELAAGQLGDLQVDARDRYARIEVFAADGRRVEAAWRQLYATLPVGTYRVEISLPTERPVVQAVLVTADEPVLIPVRPDPQLTQRLPAAASTIHPREGMSEPSEAFGPATTTHLGSLLAWAASASQYDPHADGQRLRELGIARLPPAPDGCFVRVIVGDARAPGPNLPGPIETLLLVMNNQPAVLTPVAALAGFASQWHAPVMSPTSLTVQSFELDPRRLPVPFVPGHVWTIIVVRESEQRTEIHRYLQPLEPQSPFDDTIRLVEQSWRALETRTPLYDDEAERLLERDLDPISLVVLGHRLALESRWAEVGVVVERLGSVDLADAKVLAALVGDRDQNMERAVQSRSVPVVGDGYRLMEAWVTAQFAEQDMPPPIAPEPLIGGVWTAFDPRGQAVISKAFPVQDAPAWAQPLRAAAAATARIEPTAGDPPTFLGTGFLVGPGVLASTDFIVAEEWPLVAAFDDDERVDVQFILGTTHDDRHGALARIAPTAREPLRIRWALPEVGTRIAVIGHPMITFTPTLMTLAAFTTFPEGEKWIMPGVITAVEEAQLTYECWTMAGVAGGPIIDLDTGEVIGVHHSGRYEGGAKKLGFGVPVTAIESLLRSVT